MKINKYLFLIFAAIFIVIVLSSCARFPSNIDPVERPDKTLYMRVTLVEAPRPEYYYYLAVGIDQANTSGPVPVITGGSTGWGTISGSNPSRLPEYFIEYFAASSSNIGTANIYINGSIDKTKQIFDIKQGYSGSNFVIEFEADMADIEELIRALSDYNPNSMMIQVNFITRENILNVSSAYDAFGVTPREIDGYLDGVVINNTRLYSGNSSGGRDGDNFEVRSGQSAGGFGNETAPQDNGGIDILEWTIEVRKYNNN